MKSSESEESEDEDGWQYAIKWQGIEQPKGLADSVPLTAVAKAELVSEESESEQESQVKELSTEVQPDPRSSGMANAKHPDLRFGSWVVFRLPAPRISRVF